MFKTTTRLENNTKASLTSIIENLYIKIVHSICLLNSIIYSAWQDILTCTFIASASYTTLYEISKSKMYSLGIFQRIIILISNIDTKWLWHPKYFTLQHFKVSTFQLAVAATKGLYCVRLAVVHSGSPCTVGPLTNQRLQPGGPSVKAQRNPNRKAISSAIIIVHDSGNSQTCMFHRNRVVNS